MVLNERDYQRVMPLISRTGGCLVDLEGTLQILQMSPLIWDILAESEMQTALEQEFEQAQLVLLLLSSDLLSDNYCYEKYALRALQLHEQGRARVLLILVRPTVYVGLLLEHLTLLPENAIPIIDKRWQHIDYACY